MNRKIETAHAHYSLMRICKTFCLLIGKNAYIPSSIRYKLLKMGGVDFKGKTFIGTNVTIDTLRPDLIHIDSGCVITNGVCILSHFYIADESCFKFGDIYIGKRVFIGMNTLIVNAVNIGDRAVIGAGSVVTKDIPAGEVWAGNPARFIRKRVL